MKKFTLMVATLLVVVIATSSQAQTSSFTYQGRLTDENGAATGAYDMQFKLFDNNEVQVGSTFTNPSVSVNNGVFTVQLDFGAAAFSGEARYLEIGVRLAGSGDSYEVLSPRQQLTSAVYAIRAVSAGTADNAVKFNGLAPSQYVITSDARLTDARTPTAGSVNYIQNTNALQAGSNFNISGNGSAGGALSANSVNAITQYNLGGQRALMAFGTGNTFGGLGAGPANTNALHDTFFGSKAGTSNVTGNWNTFVGSGAGFVNNGGNGNSFFGMDAGETNSTGNNNSFFGMSAGEQSTTGDNNSFFGMQSGFSNNKGLRNSAFGAQAGYGNTGDDNSIFGYQAGFANTANGNSFFGNHAGYGNISGTSNSFFGRGSGASNTDGSANSFFGFNAGEFNQGADGNSFFGASAGNKTDTGAQNSFFGNQAGFENKDGSGNSFFGAASGHANTSGARNAFFGYAAGNANLTASDNAYFGYFAGILSTGSSNAMFGANAGGANSTGFANSFFGKDAGLANQGGFDNVFVGRQAGSANISGNDNTIIGTGANVGSSGLSFATAIGSQATVLTSNTIVLGRSNGSDSVQVPGTLTFGILGVTGNTPLCRNVLNQIANCSSSLRYKTNIQPFIGGLSVLNRLRPITFDWKQGGMHDLGFGAEDIAAVEPLLVTRNEQGEVEGVKYDRITAVLVNAVKEQQEQIKQQQSEIEGLKALVCQRHPRARVCK